MATQQQLQTWLEEAEQARHELILGVKVVSISSSAGKSQTFKEADIGKLDAYIADLKRQLGLDPGIGLPFVPTF